MTESIFGADCGCSGGGMKSGLGWLVAVIVVILVVLLILYITKKWPFDRMTNKDELDGFKLYYQKLDKIATYLEKKYEIAVKEEQKATKSFNDLNGSQSSTKEEINKAQQRMFAANRFRNNTNKMAKEARDEANKFKELYL